LLASAIRPRAPLLFLNASLGDVGDLSEEGCGCPIGEIGWTTRVRKVRSYEKLSAGGMTFYDSELTSVLEETLPARFGGGPLDYQLVEEESSDGSPRLRLLVHPTVGPVEPAAVVTAFLDGIGKGRDLERLMGSVWREGGFLQVERRPPEMTGGGKIQHLHSAASSQPATGEP
jgi:hypothetical protein